MVLSASELDARIDALLRADDFGLSQWYGTGGAQPVVMRYQFETARRADFPWSDVASPVPFSEADKAAIRAAFDAYAQVINVRFVEVTGDPDPEFSLYSSPDLQTNSGGSAAGRGSWRYFGSNWDGHVAFRSDLDLTTQQGLILHELGHMFGLKHPGNYDVLDGGTPGPFLPLAEDNNKFTVMSYSNTPETGRDATELRLYDVAAMQRFWGVNDTTRDGNDRYALADPSGDLTLILDMDGVDRLDHTGTARAWIDLREGAFSSIGGRDVTAIAYGSVIENASGGNNSDRLNGNETDNRLNGGKGADRIFGRDGNDWLIGGADGDRLVGGPGRDIASYATAPQGVRVDLLQPETNTGHAAGDSYAGIEDVFGSTGDDTILGNERANQLKGRDGDDRLEGRAGADRLLGHDGADQLIGGAGFDRLNGGAGADRLNGGADEDVMTGGSGQDSFVFTAGIDRITDFDGDRLVFDPALWGGAALTGAEILDFASVRTRGVLFEFDADNRLWLEGLDTLAPLETAIDLL